MTGRQPVRLPKMAVPIADAGGALFDGGGEVVGHAHGEAGEGGAARERFIAQAAQRLEVGAGFVAGVG